ncbi:MAG: Fe-S-binding domain-containing protein, partial [Acidobacteria bacterium]|nr:Fe-S-binding domain-containing protein [Acidobacteriota bacterium]
MEFSPATILNWILLIPLFGAIVALFIPGEAKNAHRWWGNLIMFASFAASLPLAWWFDKSQAGFQFTFKRPWIPTFNVDYHLGIDGISFLLIMLTTVLGFIAVLSSWSFIQERVKEYYIMFMILQTGMLGVFMSLDFVLFYVFWEVMLVPMYFIIGVWGHERKLYAAIKFFLFTLLGSVLLLLGILALWYYNGNVLGNPQTFDVTKLMQMDLPLEWQAWIFWAFFVAFAIKVPMVPFHT